MGQEIFGTQKVPPEAASELVTGRCCWNGAGSWERLRPAVGEPMSKMSFRPKHPIYPGPTYINLSTFALKFEREKEEKGGANFILLRLLIMPGMDRGEA